MWLISLFVDYLRLRLSLICSQNMTFVNTNCSLRRTLNCNDTFQTYRHYNQNVIRLYRCVVSFIVLFQQTIPQAPAAVTSIAVMKMKR